MITTRPTEPVIDRIGIPHWRADNNPVIPGVRDYIHVMDLASGHVAALAKIEKEKLRYRVIFNSLFVVK